MTSYLQRCLKRGKKNDRTCNISTVNGSDDNDSLSARWHSNGNTALEMDGGRVDGEERRMIEYICSFEEEYGFLVSASMKYGEELIRCKDCKHMVEHKGYGYLGESAYTCESNMDGWILPDSYCSMAERKDNG